MDEAATMRDRASSKTPGETVRGAVGELAALARAVIALPWRDLAADTLDADAHAAPVVLVHGLFGDGTNFAALRRHLARHGIRRFASFDYWPRLDYQRLAAALATRIDEVRRATGAPRVDLVAHSLGGLIARYYAQTGGAPCVRRLVTLGTPYLAQAHPSRELAVFGTDDLLVPPPADGVRRRMRVIARCGHLGLLSDARVLDVVARHLTPRTALALNRAA